MTQIPMKPTNVTWTDAQWKAIWAKGQDTLVAAAAGSGKTAVLINRMIERVVDTENPIDVDELLVVTFTNASAAEMRQRMAKALEEAISNDPTSKHLRTQMTLLNKAQISTLHSFCLSIVRQYAYLLDVDPGFRIANETEVALLRDDVMAETLEEAYSAQDPSELYRLVDSFTSDRDDQAIEVLISRLYDMSRVDPEPIKWLRRLEQQYDVLHIQSIDELEIIEYVKRTMQHAIEGAITLAREMRMYALKPDGPDAYGQTAQEDLELLTAAKAFIFERTWEETYTFFTTFKWPKLKSQKKNSCNEDLLKRAKAARDQAKKIIEDSVMIYFKRPPHILMKEIAAMRPMIHTLIELTEQFSRKYEQAKAKKGIVDFSDLEHNALAILAKEENGELVPSEVALDYKARFKEVLVDEYQDTNRLQETILSLVKSGGEHDGNLFMVGDVKQSIVRP